MFSEQFLVIRKQEDLPVRFLRRHLHIADSLILFERLLDLAEESEYVEHLDLNVAHPCKELIIDQDTNTGGSKRLGDVQASIVSFDSCCRLGKLGSVVPSVKDGWNR